LTIRDNDSDFSIIIPTTQLNFLTIKCVRECLKHCKGATVIVVTDDRLSQEQNSVADQNLHVVPSKNLTIAGKRNLGANLATTTFLAFIDSDAYPEHGWLQNSLEVFETDPRIAAVCGPNLSPENEPKTELIVGLAQKSELSVIGARIFKNKGNQRLVKFAPSVNFIVRRSTFQELGGMDEKLNGGEDIEFCSRLCAQNKLIQYSPRVIVRHKNRSMSEFFLKKFSYGAMAVDLLSRKFTLNGFICLAPLFLILFIFLGLPLFWYFNAVEVYTAILLIYAAVLSIETFRCVDKVENIPFVFCTLIISTAAPGLGSLLRLFGRAPRYKKIYRNYK
jgi:GT2 family glycosyltransferase